MLAMAEILSVTFGVAVVVLFCWHCVSNVTANPIPVKVHKSFVLNIILPLVKNVRNELRQDQITATDSKKGEGIVLFSQ